MQRKPDLFEINHYAGKVSYTITGFLDKNKNTVTGDMLACIATSSNPTLVKVFEENGILPVSHSPSHVTAALDASRSPASGPRSRGLQRTETTTQKATLVQLFKRELQNLADLLAASDRHYVRCIKPNNTKQALVFDPIKVLEQLRSNGIMETVAIRKAGYPKKVLAESFFSRCVSSPNPLLSDSAAIMGLESTPPRPRMSPTSSLRRCRPISTPSVAPRSSYATAECRNWRRSASSWCFVPSQCSRRL